MDFLCLAVVHLVILVAMMTKHVKIVNEGLWFAKILGLGLLVVFVELIDFA
jgi:hypothetical protein